MLAAASVPGFRMPLTSSELEAAYRQRLAGPRGQSLFEARLLDDIGIAISAIGMEARSEHAMCVALINLAVTTTQWAARLSLETLDAEAEQVLAERSADTDRTYALANESASGHDKTSAILGQQVSDLSKALAGLGSSDLRGSISGLRRFAGVMLARAQALELDPS
jgi:hypothetical protein